MTADRQTQLHAYSSSMRSSLISRHVRMRRPLFLAPFRMLFILSLFENIFCLKSTKQENKEKQRNKRAEQRGGTCFLLIRSSKQQHSEQQCPLSKPVRVSENKKTSYTQQSSTCLVPACSFTAGVVTYRPIRVYGSHLENTFWLYV